MPNEKYVPPYIITDRIIELVAEISELVGAVTVRENIISNPHLRKENHLRTIHSSLAIENNSLSLQQMTDIIDGKHIIGTKQEILEVKNAFSAYQRLLTFNPFNINDLLQAHNILMRGLSKESGKFRAGGVGVFAGSNLVHMAPPANLVPHLVAELFSWTENSAAHILIKSCVFHYEFEFIHPFADGNGRMGRMWQTLMLSSWKKVFNILPVETLIRVRQAEYYKVLGDADKAADSTVFIEFMLTALKDSLQELLKTAQDAAQVNAQVSEQVGRLLLSLGERTLSAAELMSRMGLRHRATFSKNYLRPALDAELIERTVPDKPNSKNQKYRAVKR